MGAGEKSRERRQTQRARWALMVRLSWDDGGRATAYTTDISVNGLFAETRAELEVDTRVYVEFQIQHQGKATKVAAQATVVRQVTQQDATARGVLPGLGLVFRRITTGEQVFRDVLDLKLHRKEELPPPREERRSEPRLPVGMPIVWGTEDPPEAEGRMANVSGRGALCVVMGDAPAPGKKIYLNFKLPREGEIQDVKAVARVKRVEQRDDCAALGVVFEISNVGDDLLPLLQQRLAAQAKAQQDEAGLWGMDVKDAAAAMANKAGEVRSNIPRIRIGDRYHVFRWWWVMSWFGVALGFYVLLYFALGTGTCN